MSYFVKIEIEKQYSIKKNQYFRYIFIVKINTSVNFTKTFIKKRNIVYLSYENGTKRNICGITKN